MKTPERGLVTEAMKNRLVHLEGGIVETAVAYSKVKKALCGTTNATLSEVLQTVDQLKSRLAQAERERDAAVRELEIAEDCYNCKYNYACKHAGDGYRKCSECGECPCSKCNSGQSQYEWRGVCKENTKEEER